MNVEFLKESKKSYRNTSNSENKREKVQNNDCDVKQRKLNLLKSNLKAAQNNHESLFWRLSLFIIHYTKSTHKIYFSWNMCLSFFKIHEIIS